MLFKHVCRVLEDIKLIPVLDKRHVAIKVRSLDRPFTENGDIDEDLQDNRFRWKLLNGEIELNAGKGICRKYEHCPYLKIKIDRTAFSVKVHLSNEVTALFTLDGLKYSPAGTKNIVHVYTKSDGKTVASRMIPATTDVLKTHLSIDNLRQSTGNTFGVVVDDNSTAKFYYVIVENSVICNYEEDEIDPKTWTDPAIVAMGLMGNTDSGQALLRAYSASMLQQGDTNLAIAHRYLRAIKLLVTQLFDGTRTDITDRVNNAIETAFKTGMSEVSDGYHTFNELYHHRAVLFSVICRAFPDKAWKSKRHDDPENNPMYEGMFIVGIETPEGQATYHYDIDPYWDMFDVKELETAPKWDGHTPDEAIRRIGLMR